jgi:hypothetical protein
VGNSFNFPAGDGDASRLKIHFYRSRVNAFDQFDHKQERGNRQHAEDENVRPTQYVTPTCPAFHTEHVERSIAVRTSHLIKLPRARTVKNLLGNLARFARLCKVRAKDKYAALFASKAGMVYSLRKR